MEFTLAAQLHLYGRKGKLFMRRYLSAAILSLALSAPVVTVANAEQPRRYYDRDARDYHEWNEREARAYRHWLQEQRRQYRDWNRASRSDQRNYWRWRHSHPGDDWRM
jgi:hypothetical protein